MGYDMQARNKKAGEFHFGAFSWPVLLESVGYLFPCVFLGAGYYVVGGVDPRFDGKSEPMITSNDGFRVNAEEAKILARMARNYVAVQRSLPEHDDPSRFGPIPPSKIRSDFVDKFSAFADWAERSGGFEVW